MPETKPKALLTPEDLRWRAAAWDPDKAERNLKLQYILLGCAIAASIGWGIYLFRTDVISRSDWLRALGIALSLVSILLGIVNNRRILADIKFFYYEQKVFKCNPVRSLNGDLDRNICVL